MYCIWLMCRSETVSLPASDPEAIAYLSRIRNTGTSTSTAVNSSSSDHTPTPQSLAPTSSILGESSNNLTTQTASPPVPVSALKTPSKAPIRRKPRQSLEQMSAALDKGKKMTTLAKVSSCPLNSTRLFTTTPPPLAVFRCILNVWLTTTF